MATVKNSLNFHLQEIDDCKFKISQLEENIEAIRQRALKEWGLIRPMSIIVFDDIRYIVLDYKIQHGVDGPLDLVFELAELRKDSADRYYHSRQRSVQQRLLKKKGFVIELDPADKHRRNVQV